MVLVRRLFENIALLKFTKSIFDDNYCIFKSMKFDISLF